MSLCPLLAREAWEQSSHAHLDCTYASISMAPGPQQRPDAGHPAIAVEPAGRCAFFACGGGLRVFHGGRIQRRHADRRRLARCAGRR